MFTVLFVALALALSSPQPAAAVTPASLADPAKLTELAPSLARDAIASYNNPEARAYLEKLYRFQLVAGDYNGARATIARLRALLAQGRVAHANIFAAPYDIYAYAKLLQTGKNEPFADAYAQAFREIFAGLSDVDALFVADQLTGQVTSLHTWNFVSSFDLRNKINAIKSKPELSGDDAADIVYLYAASRVFNDIWNFTPALQRQDAERRFVISEHVHIKANDGTTISAVLVRRKGETVRQPAALIFTIYAQAAIDIPHASYATDVLRCEYAAARGYAGITAYSRGKWESSGTITPYEFDGRDANSVIDWIARQPWSNGSVGMYGGSYNGFTAWAAAKYHNPHLKTIVPYVANNPGNGLPMENNIPLFVNYAWIYYVSNNRTLDYDAYNNPAFGGLNFKWYASGRSYGDVDAIAGVPNPWFHKWLQHPDFDAYWQSMVPYKSDFAKINIPVLTFDGYYDDGQGSGVGFFLDHYRYNPRADHYLIIGPYDHLGSQRSTKEDLIGYTIDPVAQIDTPALTFQWFDYILKHAAKPALLTDRVNYEVMGANRWEHARSLSAMSPAFATFYLTAQRNANYYALSPTKPTEIQSLTQTIDLADRKTTDTDSYPAPIIGKTVDFARGYSFITRPFDSTVTLSGQFTGRLNAIVNKRDMDFGVVLYEVMPDNRLFELSYYLGRASYAADPSKRTLLQPGQLTSISFDRTRVVSRQLERGSRLLLMLDVNKNPFAEINYGTGGDVSRESVADAKTPLVIQWRTDSYVRIPLSAPTASDIRG